MFVPNSLREQRGHRGNYSMMMAFAILPMLGFGALAMDISYIRLAQSEAQDVADAASNAALIALKTANDPNTAIATATQAADLAISMNTVVGRTATRTQILFGIYNEEAIPPFSTVSSSSERPNAVRVTVSRNTANNNAIGAIFGNIFGRNTYDVSGSATSATRDLDVVVVVDITNSFSPKNFNNARLAAVAFLDIIGQSFGDDDQVGMALFQGRFGTRYTELSNTGDEMMNSARPIRTAWTKLKTASIAGEWHPNDGVNFTGPGPGNWTTGNLSNSGSNNTADCHNYGITYGSGSSAAVYKDAYEDNYGTAGSANHTPQNNFGLGWTALPSGNNCYAEANGSSKISCTSTSVYKPALGGCHPDMPRVYSDEGATDHTVGLNAAYDMLAENATLTSYRAMVMLTDGEANNYGTISNPARAGVAGTPTQIAGYTRSGVLIGSGPPYTGANWGETRWRTFGRATAHDAATIRADAVSLTNGRGADLRVNQWIVSFGPGLTGTNLAMMNGMTRGDGYYTNTTTSAGIIPIFESIARSLPMAVVQ